ncbi:phage baseplate plug family protein [Neorhizobium sp. LjRoot104]|uniref:phage baseplate plug family protein n=1 Tax=Neorhizobium sp. LjRoot104 TaxID=3342254 RepID=UPI003ECCB2DC
MNVFRITDHADQQFGTIINGRRVTVRLRYNQSNDRWSFDLSIDDQPVLHGRRIVTGIDLLAPFNLGLGLIVAATVTPGAAPDRAALPAGEVRVYHLTDAEAEALAA